MTKRMLWGMLFFAVVILHVSNATSSPELYSSPYRVLLSYVFLFVGIALLYIIIKTGIYLDRLQRTFPFNLSVLQGGSPNEDSEAIATRLKTSRFVGDKFVNMCMLSFYIGLSGISVLDLDGLKFIAHLLVGLAYIAFIYIGIRYRSRWEAMYLE